MENPNGAVQGNSQNVAEAITPRTRSTFPLSYHMFDTHRFGEYHPHYVAEGEKGDILPIRSSHDVRSYTLKSPLMQNVSMKKDYFSVPMEAILPLNWDKYYENPVRGDDVLSDVGPTVQNFWSKIGTLVESFVSNISTIFAPAEGESDPYRDDQRLTALFRYLLFLEQFYSNGSLLSSLGDHGAPYIMISDADGNSCSFDRYFDDLISTLVANFSQNLFFTLSVGGYTYEVGTSDNLAYRSGVISLRHALSLMRDDLTFSVSRVYGTFQSGIIYDKIQEYNVIPVKANVPLRLARLWAYQLVCAHYYSNDHIDFIYSAELFRQLVGSYVMLSVTSTSFGNYRFTYNGVSYQYDNLSAKGLDAVIVAMSGFVPSLLTVSNHSRLNAMLGYFSALFGYRRSLRYLDYFTGSRAQPLAVGNTGVAVVNNSVDVVNITRNIQGQRFLNAVNRIRHNFEGYLKGLFGGEMPAPDYHNPFFLAHTDDIVFGQETENTGAAQMSSSLAITTNFRSNGSRYMFEINCDRPCILIGITYYDIPRVYSKSTERPFLWVDRFDMFNPFMQYVGDQPVYLQELGIGTGTSLVAMSNFSYSLRHMEYKQRFNQAAGGFVENLPGFCFLALDDRGNQKTINPDWIRSVNSEFDNFYVSLNGWSLGSYFHFIVDNFNDCSGSRPMAYAPSIL